MRISTRCLSSSALRLLADHAHLVEPEAGGQIQRKTADGDVLVVADRRVAVAQRGVGARQFAQRARLAVVDLVAGDHRDRRRACPAAARCRSCRRCPAARCRRDSRAALSAFTCTGASGVACGLLAGVVAAWASAMTDSRARIRGVRARGMRVQVIIVVFEGTDEATATRPSAWTRRICKLPTPVLTGSGSKGLSQPGNAGHPRFKNALLNHESTRRCVRRGRGWPAAAPARRRAEPRGVAAQEGVVGDVGVRARVR